MTLTISSVCSFSPLYCKFFEGRESVLFFELLAPYQEHDSFKTLRTCLYNEWTKMPPWIDEIPVKQEKTERKETWNEPLEVTTNYVFYCILFCLSVLVLIFRSRAITDFLLSQNHLEMGGVVLNTHSMFNEYLWLIHNPWDTTEILLSVKIE